MATKRIAELYDQTGQVSGLVDRDTGEVMPDGVAMFIPAKRVNGFKDGWLAMSQNALFQLAQSKLSGNDYKILFYLLSKLDFENYIHVSQAQMSKDLSILPPHITRSINSLIDTGAVIKGPKIGRGNTYILNPNFGWKGSARNHRAALEERMKKLNMSVIEGGGTARDFDTKTKDMFAEQPRA